MAKFLIYKLHHKETDMEDMRAVYEDMGMVQLGECTDPELLHGRHNSEFGLYSVECDPCDHFDALQQRKPRCCGNCVHWEGTNQWE